MQLAGPQSSSALPASTKALAAFTLIELLVVVGIMALLMKLAAPAFVAFSGGANFTKSTQDISGTLEMARTYAMANNTYVWVGFFEEDPTRTAGTSGTGRLVVSVAGSVDGTQTFPAGSTNPPALSGTNLVQVGKLLKCEGIHLDVLPATAVTRPAIATANPVDYQVASQSFNSQTTFSYPLTGTPTYTFVKVIQFNPIGDAARIAGTPTPLMEIGLRPTHRNLADTVSKNVAAIQIADIGGQVAVYRP